MNKILRLTVFFILLAAFISFHWIKFKSDKFIFNSFVNGGDLVFLKMKNMFLVMKLIVWKFWIRDMNTKQYMK